MKVERNSNRYIISMTPKEAIKLADYLADCSSFYSSGPAMISEIRECLDMVLYLNEKGRPLAHIGGRRDLSKLG